MDWLHWESRTRTYLVHFPKRSKRGPGREHLLEDASCPDPPSPDDQISRPARDDAPLARRLPLQDDGRVAKANLMTSPIFPAFHASGQEVIASPSSPWWTSPRPRAGPGSLATGEARAGRLRAPGRVSARGVGPVDAQPVPDGRAAVRADRGGGRVRGRASRPADRPGRIADGREDASLFAAEPPMVEAARGRRADPANDDVIDTKIGGFLEY